MSERGEKKKKFDVVYFCCIYFDNEVYWIYLKLINKVINGKCLFYCLFVFCMLGFEGFVLVFSVKISIIGFLVKYLFYMD